MRFSPWLYPIRFFLWPAGFFYGLIMEARNRLYDYGIKTTRRLPCPVISVGNLTTGGTGKTPFTIELSRQLQRHYARVAVISRGYGRDSRGVQLVSDGKTMKASPQRGGDEPWLIAKRLPGVIVAVGERRSEAAAMVIKDHKPDIIVLDDAFQHRSIRRDVDVLLINHNEPWRGNFPIPAGALREFRHNYRRADLLVLTNVGGETKRDDHPLSDKFDAATHIIAGPLVNNRFDPTMTLAELEGASVAAFAGIADPMRFKQQLIRAGLNVIWFKSFRDHHYLSGRHLEHIAAAAAQRNCRHVLCTEKDMVKLAHRAETKTICKKYGIMLLAQRIELGIQNRKQLLNKIMESIDKAR